MRHMTYEMIHNLRRSTHVQEEGCIVNELNVLFDSEQEGHVTQLECYHLFEMSLKSFVFPSGAGMYMFVGFPTLEHATYSCPCEKHGSQCCHAVRETFPRKDETG